MKHPAFIMALTALAPMALVLSGCGTPAEKQPASVPEGPRLLLQASDTVDWQDVPAEVATVDRAQVLARIPGILSTLAVRAGDSVRKGETIGRITDSQLGFQAGAYGAQAAAASAQAGAAAAELDRVRFLYRNGVYAKARLDAAEASAGAAEAQVRAARASQAAVNATAGQGALVAPASGRVLRADIPAGSPVTPGMAVAVIASGPVVLRLDMPETLAGRVDVGAKVSVQGIGPGASALGTVTKLYPDVQSGRIEADVAMPGLDARFIGRRIAARVAAGTRRALLVPARFVTTRYGIDYVTLLGADGTASEVPVQTAPAEAGRLEILSGVGAGDRLIGRGAQAAAGSAGQ